jgi:phytoene desaturase
VHEIIIENGRATGVATADSRYSADIFVSNADWAFTNLRLIKQENRKKWRDKKIQNLDYSMSAFLLYIGTKKQYPELLHHTLILSARYKELLTDIFDRKILPEDFSMYLHAPTRSDASMAPPGCESMYVLIPVPNLSGQQNWSQLKRSYADKILNFLEFEFGLKDLRANIDVMEIFTPEDFKINRNSYLGSAWGPEPKLTQTAYFRPHNRSQDISNIYYVGAGTHPGGGLPGVLLTAEATDSIISSDFDAAKEPELLQEEKLFSKGVNDEILA